MLRGIAAPFSHLGGSSRLGLLLATVLAIATGGMIVLALGEVESQPASPTLAGQTLTVVTVNQSIPAGAEIDAEMLSLVPISVDAVLSGALTDPAEAVGHFARIPILAGEQVVTGKIVNSAIEGDGLPFVIPTGMRAMAISVNKVVAAGGLIRPGDRVDIFAIQQTEQVDPITRAVQQVGTQAVIIAQNVEVLAVEQELVRVLPSEGNAERDPLSGTLVDQAEADPSSTVTTLALTPAQAAQILVAQEEGAIRLAVRAAGDAATVSASDGASLESSLLSPVDEARNITFIVPEGMRAMSLEIDQVVGVGGLLRPNDLVDILAVFDTEDTAGALVASRATTLAQGIRVLAVEQALENRSAAAGASDAPLDQPAVQPTADVITLAVTPELAQQILLAAVHGVVRLSARPVDDTEPLDLTDTVLTAEGTTGTSDEITDDIGGAQLVPGQ